MDNRALIWALKILLCGLTTTSAAMAGKLLHDTILYRDQLPSYQRSISDMRFVKIVCQNGILYAIIEYKKVQHRYDERDLRSLIEVIENPDVPRDPTVLVSEVEKAQRALSRAKDGGLQSLINPGGH